MIRFKGQHGIELDTISVFEFENHLKSLPVAESLSVQQSLDALRRAKNARNLKGSQRLADVQKHLVNLLTHAETKAGYILFHGKRQKCTLKKRIG